MKKLLLIALVAGGLALVSVPRSDAGVWVGGGYYSPLFGIQLLPVRTLLWNLLSTEL
jgi:hypothetical protein